MTARPPATRPSDTPWDTPSDETGLTDTPWLTVATVVRNDRGALALTLSSVAEQDTNLLEHLIVDGASIDGTTDLARQWATECPWVRVVSEPDTGIYNAMNKAIGAARGSHVLFLNAGDDFVTADAVATAYADWCDHNYAWGRYLVQMVDAQRSPSRPVDAQPLDPVRLERADQDPQHQGAVMSRALLLDLGGFDERYRIVADYDLTRRALAAGYRPWESRRVLTLVDDAGVSTGNWRESIREVHQVRTAGVGVSARMAAAVQSGKRWTTVAVRRGVRRIADATIGGERLYRLRGLDSEGG